MGFLDWFRSSTQRSLEDPAVTPLRSIPELTEGASRAGAQSVAKCSVPEHTACRNEQNHPAQLVRGFMLTHWPDTIRQLKREGRNKEALELLAECMDAAEVEARVKRMIPAPWYFEQTGIAARKLKNYDREIAALQRWKRIVREVKPQYAVLGSFDERIARATALKMKSQAE